MSIPPRRVENLKAIIAGNVTAQVMHNRKNQDFGGAGIDGGGRVQLVTGTAGTFTVYDSTGRVLMSAVAISANTDISPTAAGIVGPIYVTASGTNGSFIVYWNVLK